MSTLLFALAFCIVAVLVYMGRYSGRLRVAQTRLIDAPIAEVFSAVADYRRWPAWNPWLEQDAEGSMTCSERSDQAGSSCAWNSEKWGSASLVHKKLVAPLSIEQQLRFEQPFRFSGRGDWQFVERAGKTEVSWRFKGRVGFALRAFAPTVQGMIALDFRYGLDRLGSLLEPEEAPRYTLSCLGLREIPARRYVYSTYEGGLSGIAAAMRSGYAELRRQMAQLGLAASGEPIAVYLKTNVKLRTTVCLLGIPVGDAEVRSLPLREMPAHLAYVLRLRGAYGALEIAWYQAMQRLRSENIQPDQRTPPFEVYLNDADAVGANDTLTEVHIPVRRPA